MTVSVSAYTHARGTCNSLEQESFAFDQKQDQCIWCICVCISVHLKNVLLVQVNSFALRFVCPS